MTWEEKLQKSLNDHELLDELELIIKRELLKKEKPFINYLRNNHKYHEHLKKSFKIPDRLFNNLMTDCD